MYGGTKEEMQRLIDDANKLAEANGQAADLSIESFSDVVTAIDLVQTEMQITGTTANEAAGTIEGSVAQMKSAWENWLTALGNPDADLGGYTDALIGSVITAGQNIAPRIGIIVDSIGTELQARAPELAAKAGEMLVTAFTDAFNFLSGSISGALNIELPQISTDDVYAALDQVAQAFETVKSNVSGALDQVAQAFQTVKNNADWLVPSLAAVVGGFVAFQAITAIIGVIQTIHGFITAWKVATEGMTLAQIALNLVMAANPFVLVATVIGALIGAFVALMATNEGFRNAVINAWNQIVATAQSVWGAIVNFFTVQVPGAIQSMIGFFASLPGQILGFLTGVISNIGAFVGDLGAKAVEAGSQFLEGIQNGFNSAVEFVTGIPGKIIEALGDVGSMLLDSGKAIIGGLADGIKNAVGAATEAIGGVLGAVRDFLPFSPAKVGPFSGRGWTLYSGRSMVDALAQGITDDGKEAVSAMDKVLSGVSDAADGYEVGISAADVNAQIFGSVAKSAMPEQEAATYNYMTKSLIAKIDELIAAVPNELVWDKRQVARVVSGA